ncbi:MAG: hypothetical protein IPO06_15265 [Leptospiraceae bacterium]|nr:hypothetical protein [Leptospiraceae bacterium]MBK9500702.1 hypothetical protein [Leptospiraceae bacterium]
MALLLVLQVLHIITGSLWLCSFLFMYFILWPSFVKVNSVEAIPLSHAIKKASASLLGMLGTTSIMLGIIRGIYFGGIDTIDSLSTPYGRNFTFAILISMTMVLIGRFYGYNLIHIPCKDEITKKKTLFRIYFTGTILLFSYALLILCMVAMRYGGI